MARSRSGSFYCPMEPAWAPLSLDQKAALSTVTTKSNPNPKCVSVSTPMITARRHVREVESVESTGIVAGADSLGLPFSARATAASASQPTLGGTAMQCPNPIVQLSTVDKDSDVVSDCKILPLQRPHSLSQPRLSLSSSSSSPSPASMTYASANATFTRRHAYSPRQPSPLRQSNEKPRCPSALWTTHTDLLAFYVPSQQSQPLPRRRHTRSSSAPGPHAHPMLRSVLKNGFLAGPMAEKARMYGLRVAWCVFGDVKDLLAKDLFAGRRPPHRSSHSVDSAGFVRVTSIPTVPSALSFPSVPSVPSVPSTPSVPRVLGGPRNYKRQSYPTNSASLTHLVDSSLSTSSSRLRRTSSSLVLNIGPINLDDESESEDEDEDEGEGEVELDAVVFEHSEDIQLSIDEKVAEWEKEVQRRASETSFDGDSSSSSSSSSGSHEEEEQPHTRLFRLSGNEDLNEDSDESDSIYDDCSDEEMDFISGFDADSDSEPEADSGSDSDSDSDSSESAESLDDEAEVERDVFSILERTILGTNGINGINHRKGTTDIEVKVNVQVHVDIKVETDSKVPEHPVGSPPTPWELPFVGFFGDV